MCPEPPADEPAAPPEPPREPDAEECCGEGCVRCVFDVYEEQLERYRAALAAYRDRRRES